MFVRFVSPVLAVSCRMGWLLQVYAAYLCFVSVWGVWCSVRLFSGVVVRLFSAMCVSSIEVLFV